ncbi:MAG: DNA polymerase III subunit alpha [Planctomycetota bacterium]
MSKPRYTHLHVHSHYSLLDGVIKPEVLVRSAVDRGMNAIALTDHGNMFGTVDFHTQCKKAGVKPITGMEAYITAGSRHDRGQDVRGGNFFHLVLLAENEAGYRNLLKLSSMAYIDGFYYKPRIDHEILEQHSEGLIGLSACLSGEVNRALLHGDDEKARAATERYQRIFSPGRFFLEIQDHGLAEQKRILEKVPPLAKELGIPLVATNDIHYLEQKDARAQEVHLCINTGTTMDDADRMCFDTDQFYFRTAEEMTQVFGDWPEAVTNADEIAAMCHFDLELGESHLPVFYMGNVPEKDELSTDERAAFNEDLFRDTVEAGFAERYPDVTDAIRERLEYEMGVIKKMGFVSYFLITWDFIRHARDVGIPVGPGRGSAVGSIVSYCLGITDLCPIKYDLIFERFLNSDRISMPDIDIDFCMDGREEIIDYVREKYGKDRVCQIITFGTMAAKAVIRDVGRALGVPLKEVDQIAKKIPDTIGIKLADALQQEPDLAEWAKDPRYQELFEIAQSLEGLNRHASTHAAGVVIGDQPLTEVVPLYRSGEEISTQYTMEYLESMGLLKMDFLGLKTLTIIDRAVKIIRDDYGVDLDIEKLGLDDAKTYELLSIGDTKGVFQLESSGMRELLRRMQPDRFEDLIAVLALYRPGPLGSGMDKIYTERKHGREELAYLHPELEPILDESQGVILYQEQVMRIAHDMAGFTMNEADSLRKAMGKKKAELLEQFKTQFMDGASERGVDRKIAKEIFEQIEHFAKYGFNKSHSTAYALISYQTAYLKANYPAAFMAGVLSCEIAVVEKVVGYLAETRRMGIRVHPPSINHSGRNFSVRDGDIHYGLVAVKGVGEKAVDAIVQEREENGPYRSLYDLAARVDLRVTNKSVFEQLIRCGSCDDIGPSRSRMIAATKDAIEEGNRTQAEARAGQLSLFGDDPSELGAGMEHYPEVPDWTELELLGGEKDSLGFYLSGHPLDRMEHDIAPFRTHLIEELKSASDKQKITLGVLLGKVRTRQTQKGDMMAFLQVEDTSGATEIIVFPKSYRDVAPMLEEGAVLLIRGDTEVRDDEVRVRAEEVIPITEAFQRLGRKMGITLKVEESSEDVLFRIKDVIHRNPGKIPFSLVFDNSHGQRWIVRSNEKLRVELNNNLLEELRALVGEEQLKVLS